MKRIVVLILGIFLLAGCSKTKEGLYKASGNKQELEIVYSDDCKKDVMDYATINDRKIYTVCISEITLIEEDITLSYHMKNINQSLDKSIEDLITGLDQKEIYKDGGTTIYRNDKMTVIACNKLLNNNKTNKDIYIGDGNLKFEEGFCTREN